MYAVCIGTHLANSVVVIIAVVKVPCMTCDLYCVGTGADAPNSELSDFEQWTPSDGRTRDCQMGHSTTYTRYLVLWGDLGLSLYINVFNRSSSWKCFVGCLNFVFVCLFSQS